MPVAKRKPKRKTAVRKSASSKGSPSESSGLPTAPGPNGNGSGGFWGKTEVEKKRLEAKYEIVALADLKPWKDNPRENEDAVPKLMKLIEEHGFAGVLIVTPDGTIRAGHTRYEALKKLGWEEAPVEWKNFPSQEAAEEYSLADNRSSEFSDWDKDRLAKIFKRRKNIDVGRVAQRTGFAQNRIQLAIDPGEERERAGTTPFAAVERAYRENPRGFCRFVFRLLDIKPKSKPEFVDEAVGKVWKEWAGKQKPVRPKRPRTDRGR